LPGARAHCISVGRSAAQPMVIVSPFAKKRFVDHTVYDTTIG
jgi:hypothetical protein